MTLTAEVSDPDGDGVAVTWDVYDEAGTYAGEVAVTRTEAHAATVAVPAGARPGETIHVIAQAVDDAPRPLKSYRRVILTVR